MSKLHSWRVIVSGSLTAVGALLLAASPARAAPSIAQVAPEFLERLAGLLANPNVAYLLLVLGLLGIVAEVATAGTVFPGVMGTICLILALVGLWRLPTNWAGVALIVAALVMFLLDLHAAGAGLSIGGLIAFALGSLLLFTPFWIPLSAAPGARLNPWLIFGTTAGLGVFVLWGLSAVMRAHREPVAVGTHTIPGRSGLVRQRLAPMGIVHLDGEEWSAISDDGNMIPAGARVRVVAIDGLTLRVSLLDERARRASE